MKRRCDCCKQPLRWNVKGSRCPACRGIRLRMNEVHGTEQRSADAALERRPGRKELVEAYRRAVELTMGRKYGLG